MSQPPTLKIDEGLNAVLVIDDRNVFDIRRATYKKYDDCQYIFLYADSTGEHGVSPNSVDDMKGLVLGVAERVTLSQQAFIDRAVEKKVLTVAILISEISQGLKATLQANGIRFFENTEEGLEDAADLLIRKP